MESVNYPCPNCGADTMSMFYEITNVPVHSVLLLSTRQQALDYPKGDIKLALCDMCGFIANVAFKPELHEYSTGYEATQSFSPTFNVFHRNLANRLIEQYSLHNKRIIEIGCGQGEFLTLLCELGDNEGVGFDPAYISGRIKSEAQVTFIKDFYSENYANHQGDFVCCKMTLEHIPQTNEFVSMVRRSVGHQPAMTIFFQVPDMTRILRELAFWDIYYEHCSYFSLASLGYLFCQSGFDVINLTREYGDQYLMIEAKPAPQPTGTCTPDHTELAKLKQDVAYFVDNCRPRIEEWQHKIREAHQREERVVIWGGGSKGVAFLTTLGLQEEIEYAVDINPHKHGTFMAGTGQEIVSPQFLKEYQPDLVLVMNPIYCDEISQDLHQMGVEAELLPV